MFAILAAVWLASVVIVVVGLFRLLLRLALAMAFAVQGSRREPAAGPGSRRAARRTLTAPPRRDQMSAQAPGRINTEIARCV